MMRRLVLVLLLACAEHHVVERTFDAAVVDASSRDTGSPAACDLSRATCTGLPGCLGESPPETMYCDDVRICLLGPSSDRDAATIASFAGRIGCDRADSCDYLCRVTDGGFDDEVRAELCMIAAASDAQIECALFGP